MFCNTVMAGRVRVIDRFDLLDACRVAPWRGEWVHLGKLVSKQIEQSKRGLPFSVTSAAEMLQSFDEDILNFAQIAPFSAL